MFKKLFTNKKNKSSENTAPVEPIFPEENYVVGKLKTTAGTGFVTVNKAYDNYPNKRFFPWCAHFLFEFKDKNDNGHPTDNESEVLNELEDKITAFLKEKHAVHHIGRVTVKDYRDLYYYIDLPRFDPEATQAFFDKINAVRGVNFDLEEDPQWKRVSAILK